MVTGAWVISVAVTSRRSPVSCICFEAIHMVLGAGALGQVAGAIRMTIVAWEPVLASSALIAFSKSAVETTARSRALPD